MFRARLALATACLGACGGGCFLFLPESHDRIELATAQAKDTCGGTTIDPHVVSSEVIDRVEPLYSSVPSRSGYDTHFLGAKLRVRPSAGMTPDLLARVLKCHAARQTLGTEPSIANSPYVLPKGWVTIKVESDDGAFVVRLSSYEHPAAKEILERARAFVAPQQRPATSSSDAGAYAPLLPP